MGCMVHERLWPSATGALSLRRAVMKATWSAPISIAAGMRTTRERTWQADAPMLGSIAGTTTVAYATAATPPTTTTTLASTRGPLTGGQGRFVTLPQPGAGRMRHGLGPTAFTSGPILSTAPLLSGSLTTSSRQICRWGFRRGWKPASHPVAEDPTNLHLMVKWKKPTKHR